MTRKDIDNIILTICPNDEDFEKPIISPKYLKQELEQLALEQEPCDELDFVQPHKKVPVNLEVCKMREATQEEREGVEKYINSIAEPCPDVISREAAVNACLNGWNKDYKEIVADIRALPPVTPQPKIGRWLRSCKEFVEWGVCSLCKENSYEPFAYAQKYFKYCPQCGAKMQEAEE